MCIRDRHYPSQSRSKLTRDRPAPPPRHAARVPHGPDPVSYTHLDVYKRQVHASSPFWRLGCRHDGFPRGHLVAHGPEPKLRSGSPVPRSPEGVRVKPEPPNSHPWRTHEWANQRRSLGTPSPTRGSEDPLMPRPFPERRYVWSRTGSDARKHPARHLSMAYLVGDVRQNACRPAPLFVRHGPACPGHL